MNDIQRLINRTKAKRLKARKQFKLNNRYGPNILSAYAKGEADAFNLIIRELTLLLNTESRKIGKPLEGI